MPIFRYKSEGYSNANETYKEIDQIHRFSSSSPTWVKIRKIYRFTAAVGNVVPAYWTLIFQAREIPLPIEPLSALTVNTGKVPGSTTEFYSGDILRLTRGAWSNSPTSYSMYIQASITAGSGYSTIRSETGITNSTSNTYISYPISLFDAKHYSFYIKGKVTAFNSADPNGNSLTTGPVLCRINLNLSTVSRDTITSSSANISWTGNVKGDTTEGTIYFTNAASTQYIYSQKVSIIDKTTNSATYGAVVYGPFNVSPGTVSYNVTNLQGNSTYSAKVEIIAYDSWYNQASPTSVTSYSSDFTTLSTLIGASSTSIYSMARLNDSTVTAVIDSSGASGPYYQLYWTTVSTAPATSGYDAASTSSRVTEEYGFPSDTTYYFYVRASNENLGNTTNSGSGTFGTYSAYGPSSGAASYTFAQPSGSVGVSPSSGTAGTTTFTATPSVSSSPSAYISYNWQYNDGGSGWVVAPNSITSPFNTTSSTYTPPSPFPVYGASLRCRMTANNGVGSSLVTSSTVTVNAALTKLSTPTGFAASDNLSNGVNCTWSDVSGAAYYGIWYGPTPGYNSLADFGGNRDPNLITGTSYLDTSISSGSSRDYYVQAYRTSDPVNTKSDWSAGNSGTRVDTYTVTWNANGGGGGGSTGPFNAGSSHTAPSPGTRSGYTFSAYHDTPSGDYTYGPIASGGPFTPPSNGITMNARWTVSGSAPSGGSVTLDPSGTQPAGTTITANVSAMSGSATITYLTTIRKATGTPPTGSGTALESGSGTGAVASHTITTAEAAGTPDQFKAYTVGTNSYGTLTIGSNTVISTPAATAPGIPGTPNNGWVGGVSYPLSWSAASSGTVVGGGAATITSYQIRIYEATSGQGSGSYLLSTITSNGSGTSYTYTSPNASLYYAASVSATNSANLVSSSYSSISVYK